MVIGVAASLVGRLADIMQKSGLYGYLAMGIGMFLEGSSLPFPGTLVLVLSGFFVKHYRLNPLIMLLLGSGAYTLAAFIPYYIGKHMNDFAHRRFEKTMDKHRDKILMVEEMFHKYGEIAVCLSRPTFLSNYFSYIAGMHSMRRSKFALYTFLGMTPWVMLMGYLGYQLGHNLDDIQRIVDSTGSLLGLVVGVPLIGVMIIQYMMKRNKKR
ncbi:membrane protein DedA with SNARE-associated domain [Anaerosolibacter carboniphilus]|uniref:Membrane protein DedA with SNARE-associated domain n=1 Tax=Anaerosolibacter carboniphilus TaxID=1417629 RepID=A0A841KTU2_9FIRM|nr:DedA family protein [Anaerosolibacter carboniphilus]MBB6216803.1 membrane protein DedA with SNARE-associated domain [Anaerosolibacter carboniphilus]